MRACQVDGGGGTGECLSTCHYTCCAGSPARFWAWRPRRFSQQTRGRGSSLSPQPSPCLGSSPQSSLRPLGTRSSQVSPWRECGVLLCDVQPPPPTHSLTDFSDSESRACAQYTTCPGSRFRSTFRPPFSLPALRTCAPDTSSLLEASSEVPCCQRRSRHATPTDGTSSGPRGAQWTCSWRRCAGCHRRVAIAVTLCVCCVTLYMHGELMLLRLTATPGAARVQRGRRHRDRARHGALFARVRPCRDRGLRGRCAHCVCLRRGPG